MEGVLITEHYKTELKGHQVMHDVKKFIYFLLLYIKGHEDFYRKDIHLRYFDIFTNIVF